MYGRQSGLSVENQYIRKLLQDRKGQNMPEEIIVDHCSPTLAGLKTANMFVCRFAGKSEMTNEMREINHILVPKGLRMIPLRYRNGKALLYVYRPHALEKDLSDHAAANILKDYGYTHQSADRQLVRLCERVCTSDDFPHEIGLFLSYPPEDVRGFIEDAECKFVGAWKVYGNEKRAKECFRKYDACRKIYGKCLEDGMTLRELAVSC